MAQTNRAPDTDIEVQEKQELSVAEEHMAQGRIFTPPTDIYETPEALVVIMEIPGVDKSSLNINLEKDQLVVDARITVEPYENLKPLYTEYSVGHFNRSFRLSNEIDQSGIRAKISDGVLELILPKNQQATVRTIAID